jgi:hypothetical protein
MLDAASARLLLHRSTLLTSCVLHRFQKALESAKHDEDMWVLLANANIHDAKARKVSSKRNYSSNSSSSSRVQHMFAAATIRSRAAAVRSEHLFALRAYC